MALNRSDKSRILRRYFPGMTRNSEMSTEPSLFRLRGMITELFLCWVRCQSSVFGGRAVSTGTLFMIASCSGSGLPRCKTYCAEFRVGMWSTLA